MWELISCWVGTSPKSSFKFFLFTSVIGKMLIMKNVHSSDANIIFAFPSPSSCVPPFLFPHL